jgi:dTDP-4-dehydrorhamnose 3,5-epimerase
VKFQSTELPGVILVEPDVHRDERGFFLESYQAARYRANGIEAEFVQDNHSASVRGTLRGLHAQLAPRAQAKLIRALSGEIFDVAVDARVGSPTFGRHVGATLSADNHHQLYVPAGFLHGFVVLSERAEVEYKCSAPYAPDCEVAVAWDDPELAIPWPVEDPVLSPRDAAAPRLADVRERLMRYEGAPEP